MALIKKERKRGKRGLVVLKAEVQPALLKDSFGKM